MTTQVNGATNGAASTTTGSTTTTSSGAGGATNAGSSTGTSTTQGTGATQTDWTSGLNDDFKGYVQNKGWKQPSDILESYRNFEKLQGVPQDQILRLPKDDDANGISAMYEKLGRPAKADGYKLADVAKGLDANSLAEMAQAFHDAGLSTKQAQALAKKNLDSLTAREAAAKETMQTKGVQEITGLKKEWGAAYDVNCKAGRRAAAELGVDGDTMTKLEGVLGTANTLKMFQQIGAKFGEGSFVVGSQGRGTDGPMTPEQAISRINELRKDPDFVKRYISRGHKENAEMQRLHAYAYPDVTG